MKQVPWITVGVSILMVGLFCLPSHIQSVLFLNTQVTAGPSVVAWLIGHFIHADAQHLAWNVVAFLVLGGILEVRSKTIMLTSLVVGVIAVNLLLLSPLCDIQYYCGLSGVINTLLGVALLTLWKETRSRVLLVVAIASVLKITIEVILGVSLLTQISWPPYSLSHLAGFIASPLVFVLTGNIARFVKGPNKLISAPLSI